MRDAGDKSSTTIDKVMSVVYFLVGLSTNIANVSQRMIAETLKWYQLFEIIKLLGVVTRQMLWRR